MGSTNNNNNNSTPSTTTTTTSLERSHFEALFPTTTTSTTTQSKWAAAATPTAPARAAPALRAPAPAANKPILSPTDLRYHRPLAPQGYSITSAFTIVLFARERCVNEIFFGGVARHHGDCRDGSKGDLTKIRDLKMGGQRT